jgi:hypothetical protein
MFHGLKRLARTLGAPAERRRRQRRSSTGREELLYERRPMPEPPNRIRPVLRAADRRAARRPRQPAVAPGGAAAAAERRQPPPARTSTGCCATPASTWRAAASTGPSARPRLHAPPVHELDDRTRPDGAAPTATHRIRLGLAILGVLALVAVLMRRGERREARAPQADLARCTSPTTSPPPPSATTSPPAGGRSEPDAADRRRLAPGVMPMEVGDYVGGGVVTESPLPVGQAASRRGGRHPATAGRLHRRGLRLRQRRLRRAPRHQPAEVVWLLEGSSRR